MVGASGKSIVLSLYRNILREGQKFPNYNFREYAKRRTRYSFRLHMNETDETKIQQLIQIGQRELGTLRRQTLIGQLYGVDKLVIESAPK